MAIAAGKYQIKSGWKRRSVAVGVKANTPRSPPPIGATLTTKSKPVANGGHYYPNLRDGQKATDHAVSY